MTTSHCLGASLPDKPSVNCTEPVEQFEDCCLWIEIGNEIMLCEFVTGKSYYYWVFLGADEYPLMICALEQYADSQNVNWQGQRADYLAIGWYNGVCYVVVIELRDILSTERQMENKFEQVHHSMEQVISRLPEIKASSIFTQVCYQPEEYKFIGIVIPSNHSKKRTEQTRKISLSNGYDGLIFTLPNSRLKNCRINWSDLLADLHSYLM